MSYEELSSLPSYVTEALAEAQQDSEEWSIIPVSVDLNGRFEGEETCIM